MIVVVWEGRKSDKIVLVRKLYTSWWLPSCYLLSGSFLPWDEIVSTWGKLSLFWVKIILQWTHFLQVTVANPVLFIFWLASTCFPKCQGSLWKWPAHCAVKYMKIYRRWKWLSDGSKKRDIVPLQVRKKWPLEMESCFHETCFKWVFMVSSRLPLHILLICGFVIRTFALLRGCLLPASIDSSWRWEAASILRPS